MGEKPQLNKRACSNRIQVLPHVFFLFNNDVTKSSQSFLFFSPTLINWWKSNRKSSRTSGTQVAVVISCSYIFLKKTLKNYDKVHLNHISARTTRAWFQSESLLTDWLCLQPENDNKRNRLLGGELL